VTSATPRAAGSAGKRLVQAAELEEVQGADEDDEQQDHTDRDHGFLFPKSFVRL
jgi:hypothetical protein